MTSRNYEELATTYLDQAQTVAGKFNPSADEVMLALVYATIGAGYAQLCNAQQFEHGCQQIASAIKGT